MNNTQSAGSPDLLQDLRNALRQFAAERDWDQFHSPKNLAIALSIEASELLEQFLWMSEDQCSPVSQRKSERIREELADVLLYLIRLADKLDVDLVDAAAQKLRHN